MRFPSCIATNDANSVGCFIAFQDVLFSTLFRAIKVIPALASTISVWQRQPTVNSGSSAVIEPDPS